MKLNISRNIIIALLTILIGGAVTFAGARFEKLYQPVFKGGTSGSEFVITIDIDSTMAAQDHWCLGDTTFDGAYLPLSSFEITGIDIMGNNLNTGDTLGLNVWAVNEDDTSSEIIIVPTDCLYVNASIDSACIWQRVLADSLGSTTKTIKQFTQTLTTGEERLAVEYNYIAGSPDNVKVLIKCKSRFNDAYE